jgi:putative ABC transport system substrate-binding protein
MKRRDFIALLGGATAAWPLAARAQQPAGRAYRLGYLTIASREQQLHLIMAFEEGLRSLGYRVGENVAIEYRSVNGEMDGCPRLPPTWSGSVWTSSSPPEAIRPRLRP